MKHYNQTDKGCSLEITRDELMKFVAENLMVNAGKEFTVTSNLPPRLFFHVTYVQKLSEKETLERKESLERAGKLKVTDFLESYKKKQS